MTYKIKEIINLICGSSKDLSHERLFKNKRKIPFWHVYKGNTEDSEETMQQQTMKFHWIHFVFKYRFLVPIVMLAERLLGKHIMIRIPDYWYYDVVRCFDTAFDKATKLWHENHVLAAEGKTKFTKKQKKEAYENERVVNLLMSIRKIMYTITLNDTSYKDFFDILMFCITQEVSKKFDGELPIDHPLYVSYNNMEVKYRDFKLIIADKDKQIKELQKKVNKK